MTHPIRLVIADLAGTTIDFGSLAPVHAFVELFARYGVSINTAEARGPMGIAKRDHILAIASLPRVAAAWLSAHGRSFDDSALDDLYRQFVPLQLELLPKFNDVIPGTVESVAQLRARGIGVAITTGYDAAMTAVVLESASCQGFALDASVCVSDVAAGRPAPWMIYRAMEKCGVWPPTAVVAVGDTLSDVEAARNAGVWAVGVTATGNMLGLTRAEHDELEPRQRADLLAVAAQRMLAAGAHAVVETFADVAAMLPRLGGRP